MWAWLEERSKSEEGNISLTLRKLLREVIAERESEARSPAPFASRPDDIEAMAFRIQRQAMAALAKANKSGRRVVAVPVQGNQAARRGRP